MNTYPLLIKLSGLSIGEAAEFHDVRLDTVKRWNNGRDDPPPGALAELRDLIEQQERVAASVLAIYREQLSERGKPEDIQTGWDPSEWPCRSAAAMALARVAARVTVPVILLD